MTPAEQDMIQAKMAELWPDWKPTDGQRRWWRQLFTLHAFSTAETAVMAAYGSSRGKSPQPDVVRGKLIDFAAQSMTREEEVEIGDTRFWVQCVEASDRFPGRLGWFVRLIYPRRDQIPDEHVQAEAAQAMANRQAQIYGGKWVVIRDSTLEEISAARHELLQTVAFPRPAQVEAECRIPF